jgi:MFS family permease
VLFNIDVFLETFSKNETTGNTRGLFLSILNLAWLVSPAIAGFILTNGDYWKIYLTSLMLTLPILFILSLNFKNFKDSRYERTKFWETLKILYRRKNVFRIFIAQFVLRFFYSWMVIYAPIYLHKHIGFDWNTLGIIFTVMLLPFVLLEFPLGKLADKSLGEKEILNTGFVIIALSVATISFITSANPIIWAIILFITRVGASMVEIASESYFFKKINSDDTNILSLFRMARPIAYLIGPAVATTVLSFTDIKNLFIILGFIVLILGLSFSLRIKDTK